MTEVNLAQAQAQLQAIKFVALELGVSTEQVLNALEKLTASTSSILVLLPKQGVL